ncbi:hypothetical protein D8770_12735 [Methylobacterium sp. DB1607]|nr:hypothetical protein [Methylobacterium sp. DB1607]
MADIRLRVLSLAAGIKSTTLALMAAQGEVGPISCPFPSTSSQPGSPPICRGAKPLLRLSGLSGFWAP